VKRPFAYDNFAYDARHLANSWHTQAQMTNWYQIVIPDLDEVCFMVRQCNLPVLTTSPVQLPYGNSVAKVPGQASWDASTFSFLDLIGKDIEEKLLSWHYCVYDPDTGAQGWIEQFKKDVHIVQYGPDGQAQRPWHMYGCWPSRVDPGQMNSENASAKVLQVTIEFDRAVRVSGIQAPPTFASKGEQSYIPFSVAGGVVSHGGG